MFSKRLHNFQSLCKEKKNKFPIEYVFIVFPIDSLYLGNKFLMNHTSNMEQTRNFSYLVIGCFCLSILLIADLHFELLEPYLEQI